MQAKRRCLADFEARSVLLFAGWTLGCVAAVQAQSPSPPPPRPAASMSAPAIPTMSQEATVAFQRADSNKDGRISRKEAELLPAVAQRFDELDLNHDGVLSREEFEKGINP